MGVTQDTASSSDSDDSSDDDEPAVKGGKKKVVYNRDGTVASGSAEEMKLAAQLAKDPWGR
jgi:hypothetical protein